MKYLLVIILALVVLWLWRSNRRADQQEQPTRRSAATDMPVTEMVSCAVCAVHLPRSDALPGGKGFYCSDTHRRQAEG